MFGTVSFNIKSFFFFLFGVILALGIINPFDLSPTEDDSSIASGGFLPFQLFQAGFVLLIYHWNKNEGNHFDLTKQINKPLLFFFIVMLLSSMINDFIKLPIVFFVKFGILLGYAYNIPPLMSRNPQLFSFFSIGFILVCVVLGIAFVLDWLTPYIYLHEGGRVFIFNENCNSTSGRLAFGILLLFYYLYSNPMEFGKWRYISLLLALPAVWLMFASGSRGSFIILFASLIVFIFYNNTIKNGSSVGAWKTLLACLILFMLLAYFVMRNPNFILFTRLMDTIETNNTAGREELNEYSISIFKDYFILGAGVKGYKTEMLIRFGEQRVAHNVFCHVLGITGLLGFIPFVLYFWRTFKNAWTIRKTEALPIALFAFMFLLSIKTGGIISYLLMWFCLAMVNAFYIYQIEKR